MGVKTIRLPYLAVLNPYTLKGQSPTLLNPLSFEKDPTFIPEG